MILLWIVGGVVFAGFVAIEAMSKMGSLAKGIGASIVSNLPPATSSMMLTPGDMGIMTENLSAQLQFACPEPDGRILHIDSSNPAVLPSLPMSGFGPGGGPNKMIMLPGALGMTHLTISWTYLGQTQTSTMTFTAVPN